MARWTEAEIAKFWEMKESGATLQEIADTLGRTLSSVENKSHEQIKKEVNIMPAYARPWKWSRHLDCRWKNCRSISQNPARCWRSASSARKTLHYNI